MATQKKQQPEGAVRLGSIRVPFWKNAGKYGPWFKAKPTRSYKDEQTGEIKDSGEFAGVDQILAGVALIVAGIRTEELRHAEKDELRAAERNGSSSDGLDIAQD